MSYPNFSEQMRILRSFDITVIRRSVELFEARNMLSGHVYRLFLRGSKVVCPCPDAAKGNHCKHAYAVERALEVFDEAEFGFSEVVYSVALKFSQFIQCISRHSPQSQL